MVSNPWHFSHVTADQFQEVIRIYLRRRVAECAERDEVRTRSTANPGVSHFAKRTGIKAPSLSDFLKGKEGRRATFDWLFQVSESLGPPMSKLLQDLAVISFELEAELRTVEHVDTTYGRAALPPADAEAVRALIPKNRPEKAKLSRRALSTVPPVPGHEEE